MKVIMLKMKITKDINMNKEYNPAYIEYWKRVMPSKSKEELEQYRQKWGK